MNNEKHPACDSDPVGQHSGNWETYLDCLFLFGSSAAKMCTVPWSLDTQMREASWLKLMLQIKQMKLRSRSCVDTGVSPNLSSPAPTPLWSGQSFYQSQNQGTAPPQVPIADHRATAGALRPPQQAARERKTPLQWSGPQDGGVTWTGWMGPRTDRWESRLHDRPHRCYLQILATFLSLKPKCSSTHLQKPDTRTEVLLKQGCSPSELQTPWDMVTTTTERPGQPHWRLKWLETV